MFRNLVFLFITLSMLWIYVCACNQSSLTNNISAVQNFNIERYLGDWYEIARLPNHFEKDMDYVRANYSIKPDGSVKIVNYGYKNNSFKSTVGIAKFTDQKNVGKLKVSFFRPFWGEYKIIYLDSNYSIAFVTSSTKDYLWLLSRTPKVDQQTINLFIDKAILWGFDTKNLIFTKQ